MNAMSSQQDRIGWDADRLDFLADAKSQAAKQPSSQSSQAGPRYCSRLKHVGGWSKRLDFAILILLDEM